MNPKTDYYAVLGVLPSAEEVVIRAAYRALAQRYHPDRYAGHKEEATQRMAELNEAYEILSNAAKRREYDQARKANAQTGETYFSDSDAPPPFDPLEQDWRVALKYYPDLSAIDAKLSKISWRLAYAYRAHLIEQKLFEQRAKVAEGIEQKFLEAYFGTNPKILVFARELIDLGYKAAAKALNEAVRVLGSGADAERIVNGIRNEFKVKQSVDFGSYRAFAWKLRKWGYGREGIREELISRGLRKEEAETLVSFVFR